VSHWLKVNRALTAKSLGELSYEQLLKPSELETGLYELALKSGVRYRFRAWRTVWDFLRVQPESLRRVVKGEAQAVASAGQFFVDASAELGMSEITLGNFLEEMQNTLFSDLRLAEKTSHLTAEEISGWAGWKVQSVLNGHPKILLNKGRIGWGGSDLEKFAPESGLAFQLHWIAVEENLALQAGLENGKLILESMSPAEAEKLAFPGFVTLPVHPWQWERVIRLHFAGEIAEGKIRYLGAAGDEYRPQISLRTLSNATRPGKMDIKLPLTILNTSAIRGIPAKYTQAAPALSAALARICREDEILAAAGTIALKDPAGISVSQPVFAQVKGAPYRYHEQLAAIWRESTAAHLTEGEDALMTGALFHQDAEGHSLIGALIRRSGLKPEAWLKAYFEKVVVPLYHLQLRYGIGLVAHGQNVVLRLKNHSPAGLFLKDFQGDLRITNQENAARQAYLGELEAKLDRLPPHYLIHDLLTGHFLTVLRFVSAVLEEQDGFPERDFYGILAEVLEAYHAKVPLGAEGTNLLAEKVARVVLNKVRFSIGYSDSAERPVPMVAEELVSPIRKRSSHANAET
jgi:aerobactin synthase